MKKVFRTRLWLKAMIKHPDREDIITRQLLTQYNWLHECEGKTEKEMKSMGYAAMPEWMSEEE